MGKKIALYIKLSAIFLLMALLSHSVAPGLLTASILTDEQKQEIESEKSSLEFLNELHKDFEAWESIQKKLSGKETGISEISKDPTQIETDKRIVQSERAFIQTQREKIDELLGNTELRNQKELLGKLKNLLSFDEFGMETTEKLTSLLEEEIRNLEKSHEEKTEKITTESQHPRIISDEGGMRVVKDANSNVERILSNGDLGIKVDEAITMENAGTYASRAFKEYAEKLGLDAKAFLNLKPVNITEKDGLFSVQLQQIHNGIPVEDKYSSVVFDGNGKILTLVNNIRTLSIPTQPKINEARAVDYAKRGVFWNEKTDTIKDIELAIFEGRLAYKAELSTFHPLGEWTMYISASDGTLLDYHNEISFAEYAPVRIRSGMLEKNANSQMENTPMRNIKIWNEKENYYTDENGIIKLPVLEFFNVSFESPAYKVRSDMGADTLFGIQPTHDEDEIILDPANITLSQSNVFYHAGIAEEFFRNLDAKIPEKFLVITTESALVDANMNGCGSWYNAENHTIELGRGGCGNQNFALSSDVIYHEYTHGIVHNVYYLKNLPGSETGAINEALADYFATSINDDPIFGEHTLKFVRNLKNALSLRDNWKGIIHHDAQILSGALWDIREKLGKEKTDKLVYDTLFFYPQSYEDFLYSVILADDDNADLSDDTPNLNTILTAFKKHGIGPGVEGYEGFEYYPEKPTETCEGEECIMQIGASGPACSLVVIQFTYDGAGTTVTIADESGFGCANLAADDGGYFMIYDNGIDPAVVAPLSGALPPGGTADAYLAGVSLSAPYGTFTLENIFMTDCATHPLAIPVGPPCAEKIADQFTSLPGVGMVWNSDPLIGTPMWVFSEDAINPYNINVTNVIQSDVNFTVKTDHTFGEPEVIRLELLQESSAGIDAVISAGLSFPPPNQNATLLDFDTYVSGATTLPLTFTATGDTINATATGGPLPAGTTFTLAGVLLATEGGTGTFFTYEFTTPSSPGGVLNPVIIEILYGTDAYGDIGTVPEEIPASGDFVEGDGGVTRTAAGTPDTPRVKPKACYEEPVDPGAECIPTTSPPTFRGAWGFLNSLPAGAAGCGHNCKVFLNLIETWGIIYDFDFTDPTTGKEEEYYEYGDAPDPPYPTLLHPVFSAYPRDFLLGFEKTVETGARVIDLDLKDDGVTLPKTMQKNGTAEIKIRAKLPSGTSITPYLNMLADWDQNGQWDKPNEQVITNVIPSGGEQKFTIKTGNNVNNIWMRVALTDRPMPPTGAGGIWDGGYPFGLLQGEAEDYFYTQEIPKIARTGMCGNGIIDAGEECDPAAVPQFQSPERVPDGSICHSTLCKIVNPLDYCGNGVLDTEINEECDYLVPASIPNGYACNSNTCRLFKTPVPPPPVFIDDTHFAAGEGGGGEIEMEKKTTNIVFDDTASVRGTGGITMGYPHYAGIAHYSRHELESIVQTLIRRHALPEGATIDILPIMARHGAADETMFGKIRNYIFENLLELSLILIFIIALMIDIKRLLPKASEITEKFTGNLYQEKENEK